MIWVPLLLAATPMLEPEVADQPRLQPRSVTSADSAASALWAVDDDPATGWTPALKSAQLTWRHDSVAAAFTVFVRPGCQGSQETFEAYARPRHITISTHLARGRVHGLGGRAPMLLMQDPFVDPPEGKAADPFPPVAVELQDIAGWQKVEVLGAESQPLGFVLKVVDTYPGKAHDEVCISDLRVHVQKGKDVVASEEQLAFNEIKRDITEQLTKVTTQTPVRVPVAFDEEELSDDLLKAPAPKTELSLRAPDPLRAQIKRARAATSMLRASWATPVAQLEANGWKRVSLANVLANDATLEQALSARGSVSQMGDPLLATEDFKLVAAANPLTGLKARLQVVSKLTEKPLECQVACLPIYTASSVSTLGARADCQRLCSYGENDAAEARQDLGGSGVFIKGSLEAPRELLMVTSRMGGEREVRRRNERELFVYESGRVTATASANTFPRYSAARVLTWSDDRSALQQVLTLSFDGNSIEGASRDTAKPEHASLDPDPDASSFDIQR